MALFEEEVTLSGGGSIVQAELTWRAHRGAPPPMPSANSGVTLQQFIDAIGGGRSAKAAPAANSTVVDPNPPRKPFTPR